ncbi:hypothetical protein V1517DRAFT_260303 [Lipomyces orientalis]|uniref:Uncharacterized protein n=1 Tax=Lipomyces orientalis TaxID=1233043 RepID=A0ACC3TNE3_9ASCO
MQATTPSSSPAVLGRASVHSSVSTESSGSDGDRNGVPYTPLTPDTPPFPSDESSLAKKEPADETEKTSITDGPKKDTKEEVVRRRTRTGCLTCRKRRIKCDEGKPKCANCTKSRRVCEGYGPRVDFRSPYFKVRSVGPLATDHSFAMMAANPYPPPYVSPHFPPFGAPIQPEHLYAASNYYAAAAAAAAAAAGTPYPDPAMFPPMPYMPVSFLPGPWAPPPGAPILVQPVSAMTMDPMAPQVMPGPDAAMPVPVQPYPYWMPPNFVPVPQDSQSAMPDSVPSSRPSIDDEVDIYNAGPDDISVPDHTIQYLFEPPSPSSQTVSILSQTSMQELALDPNEMLTTYRPDPMKSPLMHVDAQRMFRHFVHVLAHQISLFERHIPRPELITVGRMKHSSTNLWAYDVPMMALTCSALLHAVLALSALHISGVEGVSAAARASHQHASLLHYHLAIRRLARELQNRQTNLYLGATDLPVFAASLVLAFYETTIGEHDKWARHLQGACNLVQSFDMRSFVEDLGIVVEDETLDDVARRTTTGEHKSAQAGRAVQNILRQRRAEAVLRLDLLYFYLRMEVMHSLASDTAPFLNTSFWDTVPCRGTPGSSLWQWDSFLKRGVLVADFIVRESGRKRGFTPSFGVSTSQSRWDSLFASVEAGDREFCEQAKTVDAASSLSWPLSPFGPAMRYVSVQDNVVRMYYVMLQILLLRNHPQWTTKPAFYGGLANIADVADKAGPLCGLIGKLIAGVVAVSLQGRLARQSNAGGAATKEPVSRPPTAQSTTTTPTTTTATATTTTTPSVEGSAAWVSLTMPLLYAGAQLRDDKQQEWVESVLEQACARTGWRTACMIQEGLARIWSGMRDAARIARVDRDEAAC